LRPGCYAGSFAMSAGRHSRRDSVLVCLLARAAGLLAANVPEAVELPGLTRCATGGRAPGPRPVQA